MMGIDTDEISNLDELVYKAKWLEGKTLKQIAKGIKDTDAYSRVVTKGDIGYLIEKGFFGINKNSEAEPDIKHLGVEIKTCPLKYNSNHTVLSVKEPLSLNMINYVKEVKSRNLRESSVYRKNKRILFVFYLHDPNVDRSDYRIKYVFLWKMNQRILDELEPDYDEIIQKIRTGKAHEIHQSDNKYLTLCPKHNGDYNNPHDMLSKTKQPYSDILAERRAFRLKNKYINKIIRHYLSKPDSEKGWEV